MWWLLLLAVASAAPPKQVESISVGQIYSKAFTARSQVSSGPLPEWLLFQNGQLEGIPTKRDLGRHIVAVKTGPVETVLELLVREDDVNPCGEKDTTWVEVVYANDAKMSKRLEAAREIAKILTVSVDELKLFDYGYSRSTRSQLETIGEEETGAFVIIKSMCDDGDVDAIDMATDDMDKLIDDEESDSEFAVTITKGQTLSRKQRQQGEDIISGLSEFVTNGPEDESDELFTTTTARTTSQRTTRQAFDRKPVRVNSLKGFTCTRGVYCHMTVPVGTFTDVEDGDTYQLKLEITLLTGSNNWLYYEDTKIQGVPMEEGEYQFRLDARDRKGQMASAPFSVSVKASPPANHEVVMDLDLKVTQDMTKNSELRTAFVKQLGAVTRGKSNEVCIRDIKKEVGKTVVRWSNNTLSHKSCSEHGLEDMRRTMLTRQRKQMNRQFERAMTDRFNLRKVHLELSGSCVDEGTDTATTVPSMEAARESQFPWLVLLAVLAVFLVLAALLVLICTKKKGKKEKPSEYTGKGLPVVFPEEVGDDHELTSAATPMLTKEERPPLRTTNTTHENPLYRPPPPLAAASPRVGSFATINQQKPPPAYIPP